MIEFSTVTLSLSLPVARALLAFASTDATRAHICSVGIDKGEVCATDGHTSVRFERGEEGDGPSRAPYNGRYFTRALVEEAVKRAGRTGLVVLPWSEATAGGFVRLHAVEPKAPAGELREAIALDSTYLARLELVCKACRREREPGEAELPPLPGVMLSSLASSLDPVGFLVGGKEWIGKVAHTARVTIMPMRKASVTPRAVSAANRRHKKAAAAALEGTAAAPSSEAK